MASLSDLIDAFNAKRQEARESGKRAKSVLPGSDYFMSKSSKEDLAKRQKTLEEEGVTGLMKEAGREMYENPVVNTAIGLSPGAGDLQSAFEALKAAREGNYGEAGLNALGALPLVPSMGFLGKTVWHGSPHTFDKFDLSKIGTGEGAQAYGHGLYLADAPQTATSYAKPTIQDIRITPEGKMFDLNTGETVGPVQGFPKHEEVLQGKKGNLYKVDLPDEQIAKMLDWDIRLSEQNNPALQEWFGAQKTYPGGYAFDEHTGETLYKALIGRGMTPAEASAELKQAGIPGIQYLDQASRGAGEGTRNYVVFSDEIPKILERNGTSIFEFPK